LAELIAYDGFLYGSGTPLDGQNGGNGWKDAWFNSPVEINHNTVQSPGFTKGSLVVWSNRMFESGLDNRTFRYLDTARPQVADEQRYPATTSIWQAVWLEPVPPNASRFNT